MLDKLPNTELLALMGFSYMMQLDNPMHIFGSSPDILDNNYEIKKKVYVNENGKIKAIPSEYDVFSFELVINVDLLHASVEHMLEHNPNATESQIGIYSLDAFLLQITPQWWEQSQKFICKINVNKKEEWFNQIRLYCEQCGYTAEDIYEKIFLPLISLIYRKKSANH